MLRGKYKLICFFVAAVLLDMAVAVFRMFSTSWWLWIVPALCSDSLGIGSCEDNQAVASVSHHSSRIESDELVYPDCRL